MRKVLRSEILDFVTYEERREKQRTDAMHAKDERRVQAGVLTFLFENATTIRYQIHEMVRAERIVREADIQHEIDTYNELIGGPGALGCTVLVEIDDPQSRQSKLREYLHVPEKIYVKLEGGKKVYAQPDARQSDGGRVSTVQYMQFSVDRKTPIAVGCDDPALTVETPLTAQQRVALSMDLLDE